MYNFFWQSVDGLACKVQHFYYFVTAIYANYGWQGTSGSNKTSHKTNYAIILIE